MNDPKLYFNAIWSGTTCFFTIGDGKVGATFALSDTEIAEIVDELVVAANSKPEEKTDAE